MKRAGEERPWKSMMSIVLFSDKELLERRRKGTVIIWLTDE